MLDQPGSQHQRTDHAALAARITALQRRLDDARRVLVWCAGPETPAALRDDRRLALCNAAAACESAAQQLTLPLLQSGVQRPPGLSNKFWRYVWSLLMLRRRGGRLACPATALQAVLDAHAGLLRDALPQGLRQVLEAQAATLSAQHAAVCRWRDADAATKTANTGRRDDDARPASR